MERRYSDEEVAAIFERATKAPPTGEHRVTSSTGMTLAELHDIAREVGIPTQAIDEAAQVVRQGGNPTARRFLGLPLGVGRTVDLGRRLTDDEWERLVVDLRETFDARGNVKSEGSLRQWTNGNLQALLEPTPSGHRVRLRTFRGQSMRLMVAGLGALSVSTVALVGNAMSGSLGNAKLLPLAFIGVVGAAMIGAGAMIVPGWARLRQKQMEEIAARLAVTAKSDTAGYLKNEEPNQ